MDFLIAVAALVLLMFVAYRGFSVILFAPIAAMLAVLLTDPTAVPPIFTGVFMEKMVGFLKLYFPVFLLGAVFGKVIELSGFSKSIVSAVIGLLGRERAMLSPTIGFNARAIALHARIARMRLGVSVWARSPETARSAMVASLPVSSTTVRRS